MSESAVVLSPVLGAWLALRRLDRGHARTAGLRVLWLATDRTVPFGSAASHLLGEGNGR